MRKEMFFVVTIFTLTFIGTISIEAAKGDWLFPKIGKMLLANIFSEGNKGEKYAAVQLDKMNVLYLGMDNPITIAVAGAPANTIKIRTEDGITLSNGKEGHYTARVSKVGHLSIYVSAEGMEEQKHSFRVKRIPNPVLRLGNKEGGLVNRGELKAFRGLVANIENFDIDARCSCSSYQVTLAPKNGDPITVKNEGTYFTKQTESILANAEAGDNLYFSKAYVRCPGDDVPRELEDLIFTVK